jgi:hypothetical protein
LNKVADVIHNLHVANGNCKIRIVDGICDTHVTVVIGDSYNHIISSNIFSTMLLYYFLTMLKELFFNYAKRKSLDRLVIEFLFLFLMLSFRIQINQKIVINIFFI